MKKLIKIISLNIIFIFLSLQVKYLYFEIMYHQAIWTLFI